MNKIETGVEIIAGTIIVVGVVLMLMSFFGVI
jgi:hypothetical protein